MRSRAFGELKHQVWTSACANPSTLLTCSTLQAKARAIRRVGPRGALDADKGDIDPIGSFTDDFTHEAVPFRGNFQGKSRGYPRVMSEFQGGPISDPLSDDARDLRSPSDEDSASNDFGSPAKMPAKGRVRHMNLIEQCAPLLTLVRTKGGRAALRGLSARRVGAAFRANRATDGRATL